MMRSFLSRYRIRYVRSLIYMLQSSEYHPGEYLAWYHRTSDFSCVEKRKQLTWSAKAVALWFVAWILLLLGYIAALVAVTAGVVMVALVVVILLPFALAYLILLPLLALHIIQWPLERIMLSRVRAKLRAHPGIKIAVAGSYGKTSMREILRTVLGAGKKVAAPPGSYNTPLGIRAFVKTLTGDEDVLIFELGEYYPGDVKMLCELVEPTVGCITGVNEAHLEKFKTLERTTDTIFELADWLGDKPLYVNGENALAAKRASAGVIRYSRQGVGDWKIIHAHSDLTGTAFTLEHDLKKVDMHSQLLGLHSVGPLAAAAHLAARLGLTEAQIQKGIAATKPFAHRLEPRRERGITILDDSYNGNPDGVAAVIAFLASLTGRRWYITPGLVEAGSRTEAVHVAIGKQLAEAQIEKVILIRDSVTPYIEKGIKSVSDYHGEILWYDDMPKVLAALPHLTLPGDIVLIQNDWPDQYA